MNRQSPSAAAATVLGGIAGIVLLALAACGGGGSDKDSADVDDAMAGQTTTVDFPSP